MPIGNKMKYFLSLQLPEACKENLYKAADHLLEKYGDVIDSPMKVSSYHITLGVMEMTTDKAELMEPLRETLQSFLDMLSSHLLVFEEVGWFNDGAVYLKLDEEKAPGHIREMRNMIKKMCEKNDIKLFDSDCFHITLFKKNKIEETHLYLDDYYVVPLGTKDITSPLALRLGSVDTVDLRQVKNW